MNGHEVKIINLNLSANECVRLLHRELYFGFVNTGEEIKRHSDNGR